MYKRKIIVDRLIWFIKVNAFLFSLFLLLTHCIDGKSQNLKFVTSVTETKPIPRDSLSGTDDDPTIWINFSNPDSSRIIGADKKGNLAVYDLSGHEMFYYKTGYVNSTDLRYGFVFHSDTIDILAVSNRNDQTVDIIKINKNGLLDIENKTKLQSRLNEIYGLCMYKSKISGKFYVFVNGFDANTEQWELFVEDNRVNGKIVRNIQLGSQVEGVVADDESGLLYVSEENRGIWKFSAEPNDEKHKELLEISDVEPKPNVVAHIEGLSIYKYDNDEGYLIASSQVNNGYAVFKRKSPDGYLVNFKVNDNDGTDEADRRDVADISLRDIFQHGLLTIRDEKNNIGKIREARNFKFIQLDTAAVELKPSSFFSRK
jgi:3-phytase